jgi:hypothetical protein
VWGQPRVVGRERPAPSPVGDSARRLLEPLVGVDPASVRVYRGPEASALAASQDADAFAAGDAVVMGGGAQAETPETLGLLAHELTHIARSRQARFIPPIVGVPSAFPTATRSLGGSEAAVGPPASEEGLARRVEERVRGAAQRRLEPAAGPSGFPGQGSGSAMAALSSPTAEPEAVARAGGRGRSMQVAPDVTSRDGLAALEPAAPAYSSVEPRGVPEEAPPPAPPRGDRASWGSLPAPWEPLPDWLAPPSGEVTASGAPSDGQSAEDGAPDGAGFASQVIAVPSAAIQRAETGRQPVADTTASGSAAQRGGQPEPDLDALARQVYSVLRRRLEAERRRSG